MYIRCPAWALSLILIYVLQLQQRHSVFSEKAPLNTFQSDTDSGDPQNKGLSRFFGSVDRDGDGQIQPSEALSYIGANFDEGEINGNEREAAGWVYENLEGTDADATISKAEVERHLRRLLKVLICVSATWQDTRNVAQCIDFTSKQRSPMECGSCQSLVVLWGLNTKQTVNELSWDVSKLKCKGCLLSVRRILQSRSMVVYTTKSWTELGCSFAASCVHLLCWKLCAVINLNRWLPLLISLWKVDLVSLLLSAAFFRLAVFNGWTLLCVFP